MGRIRAARPEEYLSPGEESSELSFAGISGTKRGCVRCLGDTGGLFPLDIAEGSEPVQIFVARMRRRLPVVVDRRGFQVVRQFDF